MRKGLCLLFIGLLTFCFAQVSFAAAKAEVKLRLAGQAPEGTLADRLNRELVDMVKERSEGKVIIEYFPYNQLGDWDLVFNELLMGTIDMGHIAQPDSYDPLVSAAFIPYLSTNYAGLEKMIGKGSYIDTIITKSLDKMGVKYMGSFCNGLSGVGTVKAVTTPADASKDKGLIIRTPSMTTYQVGLEGLGFRTSALPYSDVFSSMQTGVVAGFGGGPAHTSYLAFRDVVTHYYEYNVNSESTAFMMSKKVWKKLDPKYQNIIETACRELSSKSFKEIEAYENECAKLLEKAGKTVVRFSAAELEDIAAKCRAYAWPRLEKIYGKEFFETLKAEIAKN